jgi:hypothetical protein
MNAIWQARDRFKPAPTARRMSVDGRSLLFCERRQRLFELNDTADLIWGVLLEESPPGAARRLAPLFGDDPDEARRHVERQLAQWLREGCWEPADPPGPEAEAALRFGVEGVRVEIRCGDQAVLRRLREVFGQFPAFAGAPAARIRITPWSEGFHLFDGDQYDGALAAEEVVPRIKAMLTAWVTGRRFDGFFAHGALVAKGSVLAMLAGSPGAGKSTLALALQAAGWSLLADDLIRVDRRARFRGVPFAPAIKEGAWPLLEGRRPELAHWPVELRTDGQKVRYAPAARSQRPPRSPDLFIVLSREDGAAARALPLDPVDALSQVLGEAYSARGRISADLMARLAQGFSHMTCRRLVYGALEEGVRAVETLHREL